MELNKACYTLKELAELLSLNPKTLAVNVTRRPHTMPVPIRIGRQVRFTSESISLFINAQQ
jgi:hypothetical protein